MTTPLITGLLVAFATLMVVVTAWLLKWAAEAQTRVAAAVTLFLMMMMVAMFAGAAVYFAAPGPAALVTGLWVAAALMSASVLPLFIVILREARRLDVPEGEPVPPAGPPRTPTFVASLVGLVLLNELLMGYVFTVASGGAFITLPGSGAGFGSLLVGVVLSPWFLFTMAGEMVLTVYLLRAHFDRPVLVVVSLQAAIMALSPPALSSAWWATATILVGSAVMIALVVYQMEYIYRNKELNRTFASYTVRLLAIYAVMMVGLFLWYVYQAPAVFAVAIILEMLLYFEAVLKPERFRASERLVWQLRPHWAFQLLLFIFVAELFMGALLYAVINPANFFAGLPALPLTGPPAVVLANAVSNGFWFMVLVTASTWFLLMMGVEMGALVYFKFRETRNRETQIRLGLMLGAYGFAAVYFPSIYYSAMFPDAPSGTSVPVLGWSMGIGSAPLAASVFVVVLATYAIVGILVMLFGRRVICSTFCTAAVMYQGTTIDSMKSFNRSSRIGHKYLGSRFSTIYSVTTGVVLSSLVVASVLSYLDQTGVLDVTVGGTDPTVFLFALYFGVLWYVMFVTIPYVGNYNCVTMGWCYTGAIAQAFSRVGFFRLKVHDKEVCRACTTLDCAKTCPVGLVDMPGHFRTRGTFRSSKCCGVGNCVGSCPYGNLYIYDVRHWVADLLGLRRVPPVSKRLPMVTSSPPSAALARVAETSASPIRVQSESPSQA